jgi:hypothetical protein
VVLSLSRDGWRETGTWTEDGESGTYDESDTALPLVLRPADPGLHRLRLRLEELSGADGLAITAPVGFQVRLLSHSVNAPLLALTATAALVTSACAWLAIYGHCRRRYSLRLDEGRLRLRAELGPGLVRLWLRVRYEPELEARLPDRVPLRLLVRDGLGNTRLEREEPLGLQAVSGKGEPLRLGMRRLLLRLPERGSYSLLVQVPASLGAARDALERFSLSVEDGVRLPWPQPVLDLDPPGR